MKLSKPNWQLPEEKTRTGTRTWSTDTVESTTRTHAHTHIHAHTGTVSFCSCSCKCQPARHALWHTHFPNRCAESYVARGGRWQGWAAPAGDVWIAVNLVVKAALQQVRPVGTAAWGWARLINCLNVSEWNKTQHKSDKNEQQKKN